MAGGLHLAVRLGSVLERVAGVDDRPHLARLDERPHVLAHGGDDGSLLHRRARPERGGDDGAPLGEERPEVERLAADVLTSIRERVVVCAHRGDESSATAGPRISVSTFPLNPLLEGDGVITIRHAVKDVFTTEDGHGVMLTDLKYVDDERYPNDAVFLTTNGQRVRIIKS